MLRALLWALLCAALGLGPGVPGGVPGVGGCVLCDPAAGAALGELLGPFLARAMPGEPAQRGRLGTLVLRGVLGLARLPRDPKKFMGVIDQATLDEASLQFRRTLARVMAQDIRAQQIYQELLWVMREIKEDFERVMERFQSQVYCPNKCGRMELLRIRGLMEVLWIECIFCNLTRFVCNRGADCGVRQLWVEEGQDLVLDCALPWHGASHGAKSYSFYRTVSAAEAGPEPPAPPPHPGVSAGGSRGRPPPHPGGSRGRPPPHPGVSAGGSRARPPPQPGVSAGGSRGRPPPQPGGSRGRPPPQPRGVPGAPPAPSRGVPGAPPSPARGLSRGVPGAPPPAERLLRSGPGPVLLWKAAAAAQSGRYRCQMRGPGGRLGSELRFNVTVLPLPRGRSVAPPRTGPPPPGLPPAAVAAIAITTIATALVAAGIAWFCFRRGDARGGQEPPQNEE